MTISTYAKAAATAILSAALTTGLALSPAAAHAEPTHTSSSARSAVATPTGTQASGARARVTASSGLNVRSMRTSASRNVGTLAHGQVISVGCRAPGEPVSGTKRWYKLGPERWVTARYVELLSGPPERCQGPEVEGRAAAKPSLLMRQRPSTASPKMGSLAYGATFNIICKVNGQTIGGNSRWYQLFNGHWVSARYVQNLHNVPPDWCR